MSRKVQLRLLYDAFNARDIDTCLAAMTPDVDWANGWEGGRVAGRDPVRDSVENGVPMIPQVIVADEPARETRR